MIQYLPYVSLSSEGKLEDMGELTQCGRIEISSLSQLAIHLWASMFPSSNSVINTQ